MCRNEMLQSPLQEMSYKILKAESIITALERPINANLLKLFYVEDADVPYWRRETVDWLDEVAEIRLRSTNRPAQAAFYFRILFDEPFGGVEEQNVGCRIKRLGREGHTISAGINLAAVVSTLREFHQAFLDQCASGLLTDEEIKHVVDVLARERDD